jgi:hypothetical protein
MSLVPSCTASISARLGWGEQGVVHRDGSSNVRTYRTTRDFHVTVEFQPLLLELIVPGNESHVVGTVLHCIISARLGWDEQSVVLEMEAQTSERSKKLVIFDLDCRISAVTHRIHRTRQTNHMWLEPSCTASLAPGLVGVNKALSWRWKLKRPNV